MVFVGLRLALYKQDDLMQFRLVTDVSKLKPAIAGWAKFNGIYELLLAKEDTTRIRASL